ncbi:MAG: hypothetical protein ACKO85_03425 [Isosphaeraceae bacterium]
MNTTLLHKSINKRYPKNGHRAGFLLAEVVAGAGLAVIALGLTLTILKRDNDLRQRNQAREKLLLAAENVMEQAACLSFDKLTPEALGPVVESARKSTGNSALLLKISITGQPGPAGSFKRLHILGGFEPRPVAVNLWRDFYPQAVRK